MTLKDVVNNVMDAINNQDTEKIIGYYESDAVVHDPFYPEPLRGKAAIEKDSADFFRAFPDINIAARTVIEKDNLIAAEFTISGTNNGPFAGPDGEIPATGKKIKMDMALFSKFNEDKKITAEHRYYNVAGLMEQLGR